MRFASGAERKVNGLELADGTILGANAVILCTGTFLGGTLFRGEERLTGGRIGEQSAMKLAQQIRGAALPMARLKTGTPPRLGSCWLRSLRLHTRSRRMRLGLLSPIR